MKHVALVRKAQFRLGTRGWRNGANYRLDLIRNMTITQPHYFAYVFCRYQFCTFGPVEPVPPCVGEAETPGFCDRVKT